MVITCIKWCKMVINGFSHLKVVNSFTTVYNVLLRINTYPPRQIWQVQAHAQLLVAVGPSPLLHICASLRRGRTRTWSRPWYRTPSRRAVVGGIEEREGGGGVWARGPVGWTRSGLVGGCSCSSLLPSRSFQLIRVELERGRPASPWRAAGPRIRVASEWRA